MRIMTEFTLDFLTYSTILHHLKLTCELSEVSVCKLAPITDPIYHGAILFYNIPTLVLQIVN